ATLRQQPWIGCVPSTASMAEMTPLWTALADHAAPAFASWGDPALPSIHRRLVDGVDRWWPDLETGPRTLIHHDLHPRNICLRPVDGTERLCAYDWELATLGAPQRDLAELLCFLLPVSASADDIDVWIERHRGSLMRETAAHIDPDVWRRGFHA